MSSHLARRIYFVAVGSFALWVGLWGYFIPAGIARALPWQVPPFHARFLGSMYLSGLVLMAGSYMTATRSDVRVALWMAAIWTGMLLVVSLLHLDEFDFGHMPVWFWFGAYIVYPIAGAWLAWTYRTLPQEAGVQSTPWWLGAYLTAQGIICTILSVLLFFTPDWMSAVWPWKIPPLLAQIYSGPFLSYAIGSFLLARQRTWMDIRIPLLSMLAFAALVLCASLIHLGTFGDLGSAAALWFTGFALATLALGLTSLRALTASRFSQGEAG